MQMAKKKKLTRRTKQALDRFVSELQKKFGDKMLGVWE
jgi:hypothetical protein